jgi:pimeloyl-ACP methyl ester carboxylesterase
MPSIAVNGTDIHYELRGGGQPLLLIAGATGDAGSWWLVNDLLVDEFTVVIYDRRGNSRSPRPEGWQATSAEEQADDAAALLDELGTGSAAVFGTSSGGTFALCLLSGIPKWCAARSCTSRGCTRSLTTSTPFEHR